MPTWREIDVIAPRSTLVDGETWPRRAVRIWLLLPVGIFVALGIYATAAGQGLSGGGGIAFIVSVATLIVVGLPIWLVGLAVLWRFW